MPTYRIYYAERDPRGELGSPFPVHEHHRVLYGPSREAVNETEWEEEVDGATEAAALDAFFREHTRDRSEIMWVDELGESRAVDGFAEYEPEKTYIWIEDGKLMEYQGIDEATPGMVACPLCDGHGEVTIEQADEYLAAMDEEIVEDEEEGITWG